MPNPFVRNGKVRTGPIGSIVGALVVIGFALVMIADPDSSGLTMAVAFGIGFIGLMFAALAVKGLYDPEFASEEDRSAGWTAETTDALSAAVMDRGVPFWVCTSCQVVYEEGVCHGICLRCDRPTDCHHVVSEDDRRMALASVH